MPKFRVDVVTETENVSRVFDGETAEQDAYTFAHRQALLYKDASGLSINVEQIGE